MAKGKRVSERVVARKEGEGASDDGAQGLNARSLFLFLSLSPSTNVEMNKIKEWTKADASRFDWCLSKSNSKPLNSFIFQKTERPKKPR